MDQTNVSRKNGSKVIIGICDDRIRGLELADVTLSQLSKTVFVTWLLHIKHNFLGTTIQKSSKHEDNPKRAGSLRENSSSHTSDIEDGEGNGTDWYALS